MARTASIGIGFEMIAERDTSPQAVGQRLRFIRIAMHGDITIAEMAENLGALEGAYGSWERGTTIIPVEYAIKLVRMTPGCDFLWLYTGEWSSGPSLQFQRAVARARKN